MRLAHSFEGYWRYMQMSKTSIFVFVEGYSDVAIYDKVCREETDSKSLDLEVVSPDKLRTKLGGKNALRDFHSHLRKSSSLSNSFQGKSTLALFIFDKDVNDITRRKLRCHHVIYTRFYTVENYLYCYGNLISAISSASNLTEHSIKQRLKSSLEWRREVATRWKEWVVLCLLCRKIKEHVCDYGSYSLINTNKIGNLDPILLQGQLTEIQNKSGLNSTEISLLHRKIGSQVESIYKADDFDKIFSGKWYKYFLEETVYAIAGGSPYNKQVSNRVEASLIATIDYTEIWARDIRSFVSRHIREQFNI